MGKGLATGRLGGHIHHTRFPFGVRSGFVSSLDRLCLVPCVSAKLTSIQGFPHLGRARGDFSQGRREGRPWVWHVAGLSSMTEGASVIPLDFRMPCFFLTATTLTAMFRIYSCDNNHPTFGGRNGRLRASLLVSQLRKDRMRRGRESNSR